MKILFIMSLLGFGFQSVSEEKFELDSSVEDMLSLYASEVKNCDVDELGVSSFNDVKNICSSLVSSKVCAYVKPEYLVDCNNLALDDGEIELQKSGDSLGKECRAGMAELSGFTSLMLPIVALTEHTSNRSRESLDNSRSTWNYYRAEEDRLREGDSTLGTLSTIVFSSGRERALEYGCLNKKGRRKVRCDEFSGYITLLTAALPFGVVDTLGGAVGGAATAVYAPPVYLGKSFGILGAIMGAGVSLTITPELLIGGGLVGTAAGFSAWLSSVVAGFKMLPELAMRGVMKDGYLPPQSRNTTNSSSTISPSSSDTDSSSAGE